MSAEGVAAEALAILSAPRERPLFLWLHFMDAHMPYDGGLPGSAIGRDFASGSEGRSRLFFEAPYGIEEVRAARGAYDAAIRRIDAALSTVVARLDAGSVVIVLSDHGEAFGEHDLHFAHDFTVYDELLRVPLIVKTPGSTRGRVDTPVSLLDVFPTVCVLARLQCPRGRAGEPLPDAVFPAKPAPPRTLFAASAPARPRYRCPWLTVPGLSGRLTAAVRGERKLVRIPTRDGPRYRAFDLRADPDETLDTFDSARDNELVRELDSWSAAAIPAKRARTSSTTTSKEVERELRALGYLD